MVLDETKRKENIASWHLWMLEIFTVCTNFKHSRVSYFYLLRSPLTFGKENAMSVRTCARTHLRTHTHTREWNLPFFFFFFEHFLLCTRRRFISTAAPSWSWAKLISSNAALESGCETGAKTPMHIKTRIKCQSFILSWYSYCLQSMDETNLTRRVFKADTPQ